MFQIHWLRSRFSWAVARLRRFFFSCSRSPCWPPWSFCPVAIAHPHMFPQAGSRLSYLQSLPRRSPIWQLGQRRSASRLSHWHKSASSLWVDLLPLDVLLHSAAPCPGQCLDFFMVKHPLSCLRYLTLDHLPQRPWALAGCPEMVDGDLLRRLGQLGRSFFLVRRLASRHLPQQPFPTAHSMFLMVARRLQPSLSDWPAVSAQLHLCLLLLHLAELPQVRLCFNHPVHLDWLLHHLVWGLVLPRSLVLDHQPLDQHWLLLVVADQEKVLQALVGLHLWLPLWIQAGSCCPQANRRWRWPCRLVVTISLITAYWLEVSIFRLNLLQMNIEL